MYTLYHFPLCPASRLARVILAEKQLQFKLIEERYWERNMSLAEMNPAFETPVLLVDNQVICSISAICEYLEESVGLQFLSNNHLVNAEIRRLFSWFSYKFHSEVTKYILEEKIVPHYTTGKAPRTNFIRAARKNLESHMDYLEFLLKSRRWLAGGSMSLADLAAATQLSCLDYLGDMNWNKHQLTKEWYAVIKSRPSFRALLVDRVKGFTPPAHYQNLDF